MKVKYQIYIKLLKYALFSKMETNPSSSITISVLPSFSKIFQKIVYNRLMSYLTSCNILINIPFVIHILQPWLFLKWLLKSSDAIDNKYYSIGVFIDLSKAFDTLDHTILIGKLEY